jgi:phospholipase A1
MECIMKARSVRLTWWALAGPLAAIGIPAATDAATTDVAACINVDDNGQRLACYDAAAGRAKGRSDAGARDAQPATTQQPSATSRVTGTENLADPVRPKSLLGESWALDADAGDPRFNVRFHNPNYLIARYSSAVYLEPSSPSLGSAPPPESPLDRTETKFQVSFKARVWETEARRLAVWLGYTQQSNWQSFNAALSRPFRETDFMPEVMVALRPDLEWNGFRWRTLVLGAVHQSNGRADPLSRSWNRVYAQFGVERGNFAMYLRPWVRIHEVAQDDNNPDIIDYMGRGDVQLFYKSPGGFGSTFTGRLNTHTGKGAALFELSTPPLLGPLKGYIQLFTGYGESLIDYNQRQTTIGVGLSLNDLL